MLIDYIFEDPIFLVNLGRSTSIQHYPTSAISYTHSSLMEPIESFPAGIWWSIQRWSCNEFDEPRIARFTGGAWRHSPSPRDKRKWTPDVYFLWGVRAMLGPNQTPPRSWGPHPWASSSCKSQTIFHNSEDPWPERNPLLISTCWHPPNNCRINSRAKMWMRGGREPLVGSDLICPENSYADGFSSCSI